MGTGIAAAVLAVAVATGAAYGVNKLTEDRDKTVPQAEPRVTASPTETPTPAATPTVKPKPKPLLAVGSRGEKVRELQVRLQDLEWYLEPKITGQYDGATRDAVKGFQAKRKLWASGKVDRRTWQRLVAMTETPTHDEKHNILRPGPTIIGPNTSGDRVRELQARLKQIGWFSEQVTPTYGDTTVASVKGFQDKRGIPVTGNVDQRTWDLLLGMTREPTNDELHNRVSSGGPAALDPRCTTGRVLCIDKSSNSLRWVIGGNVRMALDVRFGSELTPTREGAFSVNSKSRDHVSSLYDTPMPYAMFFSGGQAVHYSPDFAANGYNGASHGCVNVRNRDAIASLFDQVHVGDRVVVYRS
ncbi:MAG: L,D-transpeptidase family protein [Propionibacteriales bacterium]|nr:L,D-transpeptidase family protein [Propionibacteriales bacterium]